MQGIADEPSVPYIKTEAWDLYRKNYSKDAICDLETKDYPGKFESESGNSEESITKTMIQILRHGNPMASYMCDYWMLITALVRLLGMGAI